MELYGKVQKWIESIISDDLENVAIESKELEHWDLDPKLNKLIFRALLCLSHTAERSKPSQTEIGRLIFAVADNVCYSLTEIIDLMKYYSSLYHIARKLIAMKLYSEAMRITAWSFPSNLVCGLTSQHLDMYPKIANLWHEHAMTLLESVSSKSSKFNHKLLMEFFRNELRVLEVIAEERSAFVLSRVIRYLMKLDAINVDYKLVGNINHRVLVKQFFDRVNFVLVGEEKYDVYHDALRFVNLATTANVTIESADNAPAVLTESCEIFESVFRKDSELSSCFSLYKNMGLMLLKPVHKSRTIRHWGIERMRNETLDINREFINGNGVSWNMRMVGYILQALFDRWENCVSTGDEGFLNTPVLEDILGLIKLMFFELNSVRANGCEICRDNGCKMEKKTHTVTVVSIRTLVILSKLSAGDFLRDIFTPIRELLEENVAAIFEMKEAGCAQWSALWNNCGINIYNLSVTCHKAFYEETAFLFSLLCSCIVRFEGINAVNSKINIKNPLSYVLHRLSSVHFNHGNYREALTPCALNGLLSYQNTDSKAFRMWASIKHACANSQSILKMTMLSCLREDMDAISEIGIDIKLTDYDLSELCLQELRGLQEGRCNLTLAMQSALDELQSLNSAGLEYAHGVNLLGYHLLHYEWNDNFPRYLKTASRKLKEDKFSGDLHLLASAGIDFYTFVMNLHNIVEQTKTEMETAKFALRAAKSVSLEGQPKNNDTVVPSYTRINVSEDSKLFSYLQEALNKWGSLVESNIIGIIEEWHLVQMQRMLVIVGEYSRLHKFSTLETRAWELAYKVASQLKDSKTCVYVVGRITSLRNVNTQWINTGNELTMELESSSESEVNNAIAFFWVGLSNLYFELGQHEEGAEILQKVLSLPNISPLKNVPGYLSSMDTILRNYRFCSNKNLNSNYMVYIVRCLYSMLALMDYSLQPKSGKKKQLCSSEVLFTCTAHLSLRMNSMLSFKEISSHLINRLKLSQAAGVTLRVAECLKNLCFIDLSRMQLDDCVVKVQGMEFILQTEYIGESQSRKNPVTSTNELEKPGCRDSRVNDTSPVLRKTVFKIPEFITHGVKCECYKCSSVDYQYLVMSGTHIRAQLYFLQGHLEDAREHFAGAFYLRRKMNRVESRGDINWLGKKTGKQHPWKDYYYTVEYVLLLIDFSRFIRELEFDNGINVALDAVEICERFLLQDHPVYIAAKELVLEYQFCGVFKDDDFCKFTVPDPARIDINKFLHPASTLESSSIATPASKPCPKKPRSIRRNKTPPLLKLTKVSMILSEDEDEEGTESPKSSRQRAKNWRQKSLTRKKLQDHLEDPCANENSNDSSGGGDEPQEGRETLSEIMIKAASTFPNLSKQLTEVLDTQGISDGEKIRRVVELVEIQGRNSQANKVSKDYGRRGKNGGYKSRITNREKDRDVDKLVNSFKEIIIGKNNLPECFLDDARVSGSLPKTSNISTSSFTPDNERGSSSKSKSCSKRAKKRLDLSAGSEDDNKEASKLLKPEYSQSREKLRTSDRIKSSRSQSGEKDKPKSSSRRIKSPKDISDSVLAFGNVEKIAEQNPRSLQMAERSKSEMTLSSMNDSDIIPTSDAEEKETMEARRKGIIVEQYKTRTSSRIARSRPQTNGATSKSNNVENLDIVSTSDTEESSRDVKGKARASTRAKRADKSTESQSASAPDITEKNKKYEKEDKITELTVSKDPEGPIKKQSSNRSASGRSKLKR